MAPEKLICFTEVMVDDEKEGRLLGIVRPWVDDKNIVVVKKPSTDDFVARVYIPRIKSERIVSVKDLV